MGSMTFQLPSNTPIGGHAAAERARFAGSYDRIPVPTRVVQQGGVLRLHKPQNESGTVVVPWPVSGVGFPLTQTATLRERPVPYRLLVELARGKLNQVRNQSADWQHAGVPIDPAALEARAAATKALSRAVQAEDPDDADEAATDALTHAYTAAAVLARQFVGVSTAARRQREERFPTRLGCRVYARPPAAQENLYLGAFTAAHLVPNWSHIEPSASKYEWGQMDELVDWATANKLPVRIGPLIDLGGEAQPPWLAELHGEMTSIAAFFCDFLETTVHRYRNRVKDWVVCTGFNHTDYLGLNEDDRIRLVVRLVDAARSADPDGRWVVGVSQPWGDYLDQDENTYSPVVFADTLLRTGLPIAGFELELIAGDLRRSSLLRDGLDVLRLFEQFGNLGVPIDVLLRHPGRISPPTGGSTLFEDHVNTAWQATDLQPTQGDWASMVTGMALAIPHVQSVSWGRWVDGPGGEPSDGLMTHDGRPKPALAELKKLRDEYLSPPPVK